MWNLGLLHLGKRFLVDRAFDDVPFLFYIDSKVPVGPMRVDKPHVTITVGRRKSPGTATRLTREENSDLIIKFDLLESLYDF